jgi:monothiol bacilliredoxin
MGLFNLMNDDADQLYSKMENVDQCIEKSQDETVFILKHSTICPISSSAKSEVDAFIKETSATVYLVIVQEQRPLSADIADRLGISHQSPQAICIKDGKAVGDFSHYDITKDNLKDKND